MRRGIVVLAVALLAVTAGCNAGVHPPDRNVADDEVVTLVTDMNATDARTLYVGHWGALRNATSYRGSVSLTVDDRLQSSRSVAVDRGTHRYVERESVRNEDASGFRNVTTYVDDSGRYERVRPNASAAVRVDAATGDASTFFEQREVLLGGVHLPDETVVQRYDFEYVGREDGAYVFEADRLKDPEDLEFSHFYWDLEDAVGGNARLVVADSGVVRSFTSTVTLRRDGATTTRHVELEFRSVGSTHVPRPSWTDRA